MQFSESHLRGYVPAGETVRSALLPDTLRDPVAPDGRFLQALYDLDKVAEITDRDRLRCARGLWRWSFLLPVRDQANVVSMGEGDTPLLHAQRLGEALGLAHLYVKDESRNPTGSFKDRGATVTVSKCLEVGSKGIVVASSGNLACSLAAYCARGGLPFYGLIRDDTTEVNRLHCQISGQKILIVAGNMLDGTRLATEMARDIGLFHAVQPYNLFRIEGKKTAAFEIAEALDWRAPDRVLVPTSGCTNVLALDKGFRELKALGWIDRIPAIDVVQPSGCAPVVDAWRENRAVGLAQGTGTSLLGLGHPFPKAGDQAVAVMRATGGIGLTADDSAAYEAQQAVGRTEGLFLQPASVMPVAALAAPQNADFLKSLRNQVVVWIGTATGKNQVREPLLRTKPPPRVGNGLADAIAQFPELI